MFDNDKDCETKDKHLLLEYLGVQNSKKYNFIDNIKVKDKKEFIKIKGKNFRVSLYAIERLLKKEKMVRCFYI